jgi:hypothetical protein
VSAGHHLDIIPAAAQAAEFSASVQYMWLFLVDAVVQSSTVNRRAVVPSGCGTATMIVVVR